MNFLKRIASITLSAVAGGLPGGISMQTSSNAPIWYKALASLAGGLGVGLLALVVGAIALFAARSKPDGGLTTALVITIVISLFCSLVVIYGLRAVN